MTTREAHDMVVDDMKKRQQSVKDAYVSYEDK